MAARASRHLISPEERNTILIHGSPRDRGIRGEAPAEPQQPRLGRSVPDSRGQQQIFHRMRMTVVARRYSAVPMGFLQSTFSLLIGTGCGIYIAQNYDVPNIKKLMRSLVGKAKEVEESYKKTGNSKNKDNE
ncbi:hypothetical protein ZEAMMB73_Zm00001d035540 [Zea mays]|uniref:Uncharacterized protein n=2 Tax=Zea mays TaxID=4577 RepID=A0A1D6LH29_MAIZE|nr:hypothetical protein ZEAMMB73_Zm00001d035540 [Zea mays]